MDFNRIDTGSLTDMYKGMRRLETLNPEGMASLEIYLYGITSDAGVLGAAKETLIDNMEEFWDDDGTPTINENDVLLSEVAVALPLNSDMIWAITGEQGIDLMDLEFAYDSGEGEGVREAHFQRLVVQRGRIALSALRDTALASGSYHLKEFMMKHKKGQAMSFGPSVKREDPAIAQQRRQQEAEEMRRRIKTNDAWGQTPRKAAEEPKTTPGNMEELLEAFLARNR